MPPLKQQFNSEKSEVDTWLDSNIGGAIMLLILVGIAIVFILAMFGVNI